MLVSFEFWSLCSVQKLVFLLLKNVNLFKLFKNVGRLHKFLFTSNIFLILHLLNFRPLFCPVYICRHILFEQCHTHKGPIYFYFCISYHNNTLASILGIELTNFTNMIWLPVNNDLVAGLFIIVYLHPNDKMSNLSVFVPHIRVL